MIDNHIEKCIYDRISHDLEKYKNRWESYSTNVRFFIVDDLLPNDIFEKLYPSFIESKDDFYNRKSFRERKKTSSDMNKHDKLLSDCIYAFQAEENIKLIEYITGIHNLEPDPLLYAGGLSIMNKGDFLNPHIDNSHDRDKRRYRRLNLLYYITPNWTESMGGSLELWDRKVTKATNIEACNNRLVIMETNSNSWHSVSKIKSNFTRCCISNYFFTQNSPTGKQYHHVTSFQGRPNEKLKRLYCPIDNFIRNLVSRYFKLNRGRGMINRT